MTGCWPGRAAHKADLATVFGEYEAYGEGRGLLSGLQERSRLGGAGRPGR